MKPRNQKIGNLTPMGHTLSYWGTVFRRSARDGFKWATNGTAKLLFSLFSASIFAVAGYLTGATTYHDLIAGMIGAAVGVAIIILALFVVFVAITPARINREKDVLLAQVGARLSRDALHAQLLALLSQARFLDPDSLVWTAANNWFDGVYKWRVDVMRAAPDLPQAVFVWPSREEAKSGKRSGVRAAYAATLAALEGRIADLETQVIADLASAGKQEPFGWGLRASSIRRSVRRLP